MVFDIFYIFNQKDGIFYIFNQKRWVFFLIFWYESKGILILTNIFKILFKAISLEHTFYFLLFITFFWYESKGILILYKIIFLCFCILTQPQRFATKTKSVKHENCLHIPCIKKFFLKKSNFYVFFLNLLKMKTALRLGGYRREHGLKTCVTKKLRKVTLLW